MKYFSIKATSVFICAGLITSSIVSFANSGDSHNHEHEKKPTSNIIKKAQYQNKSSDDKHEEGITLVQKKWR